jgi:ferric-dicitrate binding protein FerR (iron transport regulator)
MEHQLESVEDFLLNDSFLRYCAGVGVDDVAHWEQWIAAHPEKQEVVEQARQLFVIMNGRQGNLAAETAHFRELLKERAHEERRRIRRMRYRQFAAAAVLAGTIAAGWWFMARRDVPAKPQTAQAGHDVMPGRTRAQLQLGDGTTLNLDSMARNGLREKDGTRIGSRNGQLVYDASSDADGGELIYNTLQTPPGGEYELVLPDGSRVWLNAASSLRFPTRFSGNDRTVELSGEAYFEIAPNAAQPFFVQAVHGPKVAVLGTSFNISAYSDDPSIQTTLMTGKVKVISPQGKSVTLRPSQQARIAGGGGDFTVMEADTDKIIAWKTGTFEFEDDDLYTVMKQLARWYDVEVKYEGNLPDKHYTGSIRRQSTLSQALRILKTAGINFSIDGRRIIVKAQ